MSPVITERPVRNRVRRRRKRRRPLLLRLWWLGLPIIPLLTVAIWIKGQMGDVKHPQPLTGYVGDRASFDQEYLRYNGKPLKDAEIRTEFLKADELASKGEYNGAILLLETIAKKAALPVVFNDMGVLYAKLDDRAGAINSFRDALARDFDYAPVRRNVERLRGFTTNSADPVTSEIEPNNNIENANVIALDKPVQGEVGPDNDIDVFKVTAPPAPRDLLLIRVETPSKTLLPHLSVYDEDGVILPFGKTEKQPGATLIQMIAPKPNTTFYLFLSGYSSSSGSYTLSVERQKAFDAYETNDDIYSATKLVPGQQIEASIMDDSDLDFYTFVAPRTGQVSIHVGGTSTTLIPALTTFGSDLRVSGFGPEIRTPGTPLHHTMAVQEGVKYFIEVWAQGKSFGRYTLKVE